MLKPPITEPLREHYESITKVPSPIPLYQGEPTITELQHTLFETFPETKTLSQETEIPHIVFQELESDMEHVTMQLATVSKTHDERLLLKQKRISEIDQQLEAMQRYLSQISRWSPGYNSGIDSMRSSLLSSKSHLEQEKHIENLKCLEDCSKLEQSLLSLIRQYDRLKTDFDLLSQVKEGGP